MHMLKVLLVGEPDRTTVPWKSVGIRILAVMGYEDIPLVLKVWCLFIYFPKFRSLALCVNNPEDILYYINEGMRFRMSLKFGYKIR